jgi:hypothetical protein
VLALELDLEVKPEHIRIRKDKVSDRVAAKIGTHRCNLRLEVSESGYGQYSSDTQSEDERSDVSAEDMLERSLERVTSSRHWPSHIEAADIKAIWKGHGSVLLVLSLPEPAGLLLLQLAQQRIAPLLAESVRCCKYGELVTQLDEKDDMAARVQILHDAEAKAKPQIDRIRAEAAIRRAAAAARWEQQQSCQNEDNLAVTEAEMAAFHLTLRDIIFAPDHFAALGLERSAGVSARDVNRAFRAKAKAVHPDKFKETRRQQQGVEAEPGAAQSAQLQSTAPAQAAYTAQRIVATDSAGTSAVDSEQQSRAALSLRDCQVQAELQRTA